ncbi:hypothetical protein Nepgr_021248 [Nepenthes gracilis]|uniref:Uncharacterized protein n=1 Tax=Nepenthes gracilis TaxID=150966 RepID=A0AAD3XVS5_NEPGR|nr:hypothetical protein Nepgr_021248 [Nepenthes gracilis]
MGRPPCCDKTNVKRGLWTAEEDAKILAYVSNHGIGNWTLVPKKAGLNRCGKSCRLRWTNYLRPDLKHDSFTPQEEQLIIQLHKAIGSRWSLIAKQLHGRTDNDVKNYWNTKLKKKLTKMGIDPVTHKPFSQILCDYENISNLPNTHKIRMPTTDMQFQGNCSLEDSKSQLKAANQQHFMDEVISPSSSSSSTSSILWQQPSPASITASYGCSEVLAGDPHPQIQMLGVEDHLSGTSGYKFTESGITGCSCEPSSSSANSFIESIVDRDIQMRLEFPALDEILDY